MPDIITTRVQQENSPVIGESCENYLDSLKAFNPKELNTLRDESLNIYSSFLFKKPLPKTTFPFKVKPRVIKSSGF